LTDRQIDRRRVGRTDWCTNREIDRLADRQTVRRKDRQNGRQTEWQTDRRTDRQKRFYEENIQLNQGTLTEGEGSVPLAPKN